MSDQTEVKESPFLDTVINCVLEVEKKEPKQQNNLQNLYGEAGELIKQFDSTIGRCKRYNEAKINRKYQMVITDLENQLRKLNQKLKIQQDARSPTKKHVTQILDQLVTYKQENQRLKKQIVQNRQTIFDLKNKNQLQANAIKNLQNTQPKALVQRLPSLNSKGTVCQAIKQYLKDKQNVRKVISNTVPSILQKFLNAHIAKTWNWTIGNLLQQIDKWAEGIKPTKQVDMWKIRSSVARSFSQYIEDSNSLTRPSSLTKAGSGTTVLSPLSGQQNHFLKKQSRFSGVSARKEKNLLTPSLH